jgi:DNA-binding NtrC family response regulator
VIPAPRRVLVVEDESGQRLMYERALREMDFEAVCAATPGEARRRLIDEPFPIALLDLNLGGEHGMDLFEEIRERHPATSVIIATGYGTFEVARRSIKLDVIDFLTKPVPLGDLERALDRAWSRHVLVQTPVARLLPPIRAHADEGAGDEPFDSAAREDLSIDAMERDLIMEALRRCDDNRREAAKLLGISERKLYYRLTQYRLR